MTGSNSSVVIWVPEVIGYVVSTVMYGATLGQSTCYVCWFPDDPWFIKFFVFMALAADTTHFIGSTQLVWARLVSCHQDHSWYCQHAVLWGSYVVIWFNYHIIFAVECFYCHRVWTISGNNKLITLAILVLAAFGYAFGTWYFVELFQDATIDYLLSSPLILPCAIFNTFCDTLITFVIFKYMWKSGFRKQRTMIQDMALVCINTGAFTCTISILLCILFLAQNGGFWVASAGLVFGRSYVNSMMAVLNARKIIRDRDVNYCNLTTIPITLQSFPPLSFSHNAP